MEQIVVKIEDQNNGEILLYYVDENGEHQEGVLTTIQNIENSSIQLQDNSYILGNLGELVGDGTEQAQIEEEPLTVDWNEDDTKRLLIFFNDNKASFISGSTEKKHLWTVACKTMLIGKNQESCDAKLEQLKDKYCELRGLIHKGHNVKWPFFDLCHKAFYDDAAVKAVLDVLEKPEEPMKTSIIKQDAKEDSSKQTVPNDYIVSMLNLYLKYKPHFRKDYWRRDLWDTIAAEMGEDDGEYVRKRFFNYKQHYIKMLTKKKEGLQTISWPYMKLFDEIFHDDVNFHKKYFSTQPETVEVEFALRDDEWNDMDKMVLAKYCYDAYEEFEDPTIPDMFLWTEIGRFLDKRPTTCRDKFEELREEHMENYLSGNYSLSNRKPLSIIYDSLISKDVKKDLSKSDMSNVLDPWKTESVDELVQFFYDSIELFKDSICHFVCFEVISKKLKKDVDSCKKQWDDLVILYNSILVDKKENPDMQIDWRYIELFDRMFDYGMDSTLLNGFDFGKPEAKTTSGVVEVKKVSITNEDKRIKVVKQADDEQAEPRTDPRSAKILEHYLKNKDKFQIQRNKLSLWDPLAVTIGINSTQCAHRLRALRQTYIEYIQKEIDQPRGRVITWPYYALCKKVFGYRNIKNKLKLGQYDAGKDDWLAREIKQLITYFSKNFDEITNNIEDVSKWTPLASELGKSAGNCKEKFVELRKCYRKLKTMRSRNPGLKISWSYFNMFERIYSIREGDMEVETLEDYYTEMDGVENVENVETMEAGEGGEDDYQCIIVLPEGQDLSDLSNAQIIIEESSQDMQQVEDIPQVEKRAANKWTKRTKKRLLIFYINYIRMNKGREINAKDMWKEISRKIPNKSAIECRKMFAKLKMNFINADDITKLHSPFTSLLERVLKLKPRFAKSIPSRKEEKIYRDVELPGDKINLALNYYLEHLEDFVNPKFEKKYLWTELANHISEPVNKVFNKINYLKQAYNILTEEVNGEKTEFNQLLKDIITKEVAVKALLEDNTSVEFNGTEEWSECETETLLQWYLGNLDKFKNAKFNRSYLWLEASTIMNKNPVVCSKKMNEIRTQYRNMVRQNSEELRHWRYLELCQKIYGTGKKGGSFENN